MKPTSLIIFILIATSLWACKPPKKGALSAKTHHEITLLAENKVLEPEEKFHKLGIEIARAMEEALAHDEQDSMVLHLRDFSRDNQKALNMLSIDLDDWFKTMTEEEKLYFVMRMVPMDYAQKLKRSEKRYKKRIQNNSNYLAEYERLMRPLEMRK